MNSILVQSLPLREVIGDIAEALGTSYEENCQEYLLRIPPSNGQGTICGINFTGGLGLIQYKCRFKKDTKIQFFLDQVHPLKFVYVSQGQIKHRFQNEEDSKDISQFQSAIVASNSFSGHEIFFGKNQDIHVQSLEIDRKLFKDKMDCELKGLNGELQQLLQDHQASKSFRHNGSMSLQIADIFKTMEAFKEEDFLRKLFLEGMAYQLLTLQIMQYNDDKLDVGNRSIMRLSELQQVRRIAERIESSITEISTVNELAVEAGINVNKLQEGFKYLYQNTVNGYVQKTRLNMAKDLLHNTELTISEIVGLIGLSSKSYFSKIFREKYGISPSEYRKSRKTKS